MVSPQAVSMIQRNWRAKREWSAEFAKLRAVLAFERAALLGAGFAAAKTEEEAAGPTLLQQRNAATVIQARARGRNERRKLRMRMLPEERAEALQLITRTLDDMQGYLPAVERAVALLAKHEETMAAFEENDAEDDGELATGQQQQQGPAAASPALPKAGAPAEGVVVGEGGGAVQVAAEPHTPRVQRGAGGAPRPTNAARSTRVHARQLPEWIYERIGEA